MSIEWLHRSTQLRVTHRDATAHGGPIGHRIEHTVRSVFADALTLVSDGRSGDDPLVLDALRAALDTDAFRALATVHADGLGWTIHPDVLHADPELTRPHELLVVAPGGRELDVRLPPSHWPQAHDLLARLNGPHGVGAGERVGLPPDMVALLDALREMGALTREPLQPLTVVATRPGITFLGHNAVLVRGDAAAVLVDPFLPRPGAAYPAHYQPVACDQLGHVDALLITHGHPDHFDPASLLRFPVDTTVVIPAVERESVLAPDLHARLLFLGFTDVRVSAWGSVLRFGDVEVDVLPFFGEQATDGERLHPEIVNAGNTYVVRSTQQHAAFMADAGSDDRGSSAAAAAQHRARHGPLDVVFAGYRGWRTTPAELLRSSVARFFLFVPPDQWPRSMNLMNDAVGALETAAAFGATTLVPYADGGAPWFWQLGLGPRLDESPLEREGFDPFPERVVEAAALMADAPAVLVLRPGQRLEPDGRVQELAGHVWPWPPVDLRTRSAGDG